MGNENFDQMPKYIDLEKITTDRGTGLEFVFTDGLEDTYEEEPVYSIEAAMAVIEKFHKEGKISSKRLEALRKDVLESELPNEWTEMDKMLHPDLWQEAKQQ
jgi:hypothetical protein